MAPASVEIETLLPHRGSMLLIAQIISFDAQRAVTRAIVKESWPLTDAVGAQGLVLIELVAQTAGVNNGWEILQREGPGSDHRGWIVGIKSARIEVDTIAIDTCIVTSVVNQFEYENFREIHGVTTIDDQVVGEVTLHLLKAE